MRYRLYQPSDFAALYAVEELCFEPPFRFSRSLMRQLIESSNSATWIAEEDAQLVGFSIVEWTAQQNETSAYLQTIEVHPTARARGIGAELLGRVEGSARTAGAEIIRLHVDVE
ncbi:MAG: GNAT family N-acetyltransferase, partial [Terracidiphilus sp.]